MIDPSVTSSLIGTYGAAGAIIVVLLGVCSYLFVSLKSTQEARFNDMKDMLSKNSDESAATAAVLRDLKTSIDGNSQAMQLTLAMLKEQSK